MIPFRGRLGFEQYYKVTVWIGWWGLKEFEEFTDVEHMQLLKHCQTRWLSPQRAVTRIMLQYPALQAYFASHDEVERPRRMKRTHARLHAMPRSLIFLLLDFIQPSLNELNTLFQVDNLSACHECWWQLLYIYNMCVHSLLLTVPLLQL